MQSCKLVAGFLSHPSSKCVFQEENLEMPNIWSQERKETHLWMYEERLIFHGRTRPYADTKTAMVP